MGDAGGPSRVAHPPIRLRTFSGLKQNRLAMAGACFIAAVCLAALLAPVITPFGFADQDLTSVLAGPSLEHPFGTDELGRDVLARLVYGARTSLAIGVLTQFLVLLIGVPVGAVAGSLGGKADGLLMRFVDVMYAFPDLLLIILFRAVLGSSIFMVFVAIGLVAWVNVARLVRGQILSLKQRDFVTAAEVMGGSRSYIALRHLLPNSLGPVIVVLTFNIPRAIFAEAALSYIGIGVQSPTPSWGIMVQDGYQLMFSRPALVLLPVAAISLLMLAFTWLGEGLRDALDPRTRKA
ncbi:MAG: ABC transporter permease [Chloroflexi bacterium]|nr:ABC transporter permease [Chloroflexota bacterium]